MVGRTAVLSCTIADTMLVFPRYRDSRRALEVVQPLITNFPNLATRKLLTLCGSKGEVSRWRIPALDQTKCLYWNL